MGTHYRRQDVISQYEHVFGSCPNSCRGVPLGAPSRAEKGAPTEGGPYSFVNNQVLDLSSNWAAEKEETPVSVVGVRETGGP